MAKDMMGNVVKVGDSFLMNNIVFTVKEIRENRVLGGRFTSPSKGTALKIPDEIVLECTFPGDFEKPLQGFVLKTPPETNAPEA